MYALLKTPRKHSAPNALQSLTDREDSPLPLQVPPSASFLFLRVTFVSSADQQEDKRETAKGTSNSLCFAPACETINISITQSV